MLCFVTLDTKAGDGRRAMKPHRFLTESCRVSPAAGLLAALLVCGSGCPAAGPAGDAPADQEAGVISRPPAVAGTFYPGDPAVLRETVRNLLDESPLPEAEGIPRGAVAPHAGYIYSGKCAATVYRVFEGRDVRRVILLGPSHHDGFSRIAVTGASSYRTPLGEIQVDRTAVEQLRTSDVFRGPHPAEGPEHGLEVQIPFLQVVCPNARLVPLLVGRLDLEDVRSAARALARIVDEHTIIVASCDFTHYGPRYGYVPFTRDVRAKLDELDGGAIDRILALDPEAFLDYQQRTGATICGRYPVAVVLETLRERWPGSVRADLLSRYTSADVMGDEANSVSYVGIVFRETQAAATGAAIAPADVRPPPGKESAMNHDAETFTPEEQTFLLRLARETIDRVVDRRASPPHPKPEDVPERLRRPGKVFVTLNEGGELRGCIGTLEAVEPLYESVINNAVNAATRDWRFPTVRPEELGEIEIEISVMSPNRPIPGADHFQVGVHGIILEKSGRRAVFLPQVAPEQGWDREETLAHLSMKAGLPRDAWKEGATFEIFTAQVFGEHAVP